VYTLKHSHPPHIPVGWQCDPYAEGLPWPEQLQKRDHRKYVIVKLLWHFDSEVPLFPPMWPGNKQGRIMTSPFFMRSWNKAACSYSDIHSI